MDECKHTHREQDEKSKLINRLNRLEGQIRGIKNMVEEGVELFGYILCLGASVNLLGGKRSS